MRSFRTFIILFVLIFIFISSNIACDAEKFYEKYKVNVDFSIQKDTWNQVTYKTLLESEKGNFVDLIDYAFSKYPIGFFEKIKLDQIILVKELKFSNVSRAAVPDNYKHALFLSYNPSYTDSYMVHCIFHELNHYVEYYLWKDYRYQWNDWKALYNGNTNGGESAYATTSIDYYNITSSVKGFLNLYSTLGQEEDRSEIIAFFMTDINNEHNKMMDIVKNDKILQQKTDLMLKLYKDKLGFNQLLDTYMSEINR